MVWEIEQRRFGSGASQGRCCDDREAGSLDLTTKGAVLVREFTEPVLAPAEEGRFLRSAAGSEPLSDASDADTIISAATKFQQQNQKQDFERHEPKDYVKWLQHLLQLKRRAEEKTPCSFHADDVVLRPQGKFVIVGGGVGTKETESCTLNGDSIQCATVNPKLNLHDTYPEIMSVSENFCLK